MPFLRKAASFLKMAKTATSDGGEAISNLIGMFAKIGRLKICFMIAPVLAILLIFATLIVNFSSNVSLAQMVDTTTNPAENNNASHTSSGGHQNIIEIAKTQLGEPYCDTYSAADPGGCGFNCSGFTWWVYDQAGYEIPNAQGYISEFAGSENGENSQAYWVHSRGHWRDNIEECSPGDLVFFSKSGVWSATYHVAIYMGDNQIIHSSTGGVQISAPYDDFIGCGWPLD